MTDLTIHTYRWCAENVSYRQKFKGKHGKIYVVTCNESNSGKYAVNWKCTCPGWQYRGSCKHKRIAVSRRCGYGNGAVVGSPIEMGDTCPLCGGPTVVVEVAV